jgi:biotin carboxylase
MAHILLVEIPCSNDFSLMLDIINLGHQVTLFTQDEQAYLQQGSSSREVLTLARQIVEIPELHYAQAEQKALQLHQKMPFDAIICIVDAHMVLASKLASRLNLRFLNPETTALLYDTFSFREKLAQHGIKQSRFATGYDAGSIRHAAGLVGFPLILKPVNDIHGQHVCVIDDMHQLEHFLNTLKQQDAETALQGRNPTPYYVEQYISGQLIGCDIFTTKKQRIFLGVNEKQRFALPSVAIRGSCFPSVNHDVAKIRQYAFKLLDALNFDFGTCHIEMIISDNKIYLVSITPRLFSTQTPLLMGYALERSICKDIINLYLGDPLFALQNFQPALFCASRWLSVSMSGIISSITLADMTNPAIRRVVLFRHAGSNVTPALNNEQRIGYVMSVATSQHEAEVIADNFIAATHVVVT